MEALLFRYYTAKKALEDKRKELEGLELECEVARKACVEGGVDLGVFGDPSNSLDCHPSNNGEPIVVHPSAPPLTHSLPGREPPQEGYLRDGPNWQIDCSVGSVGNVVKRFILNSGDSFLNIREFGRDVYPYKTFQWVPPGELAKLVAHRGDFLDSSYMVFHVVSHVRTWTDLEMTCGRESSKLSFAPIGVEPWVKPPDGKWVPLGNQWKTGATCRLVSGTTYSVGKPEENFFIKATKIQ